MSIVNIEFGLCVYPDRTSRSRCRWHKNATLLPLWGHCQHSVKDGINQ